jgi:hypothetical protein
MQQLRELLPPAALAALAAAAKAAAPSECPSAVVYSPRRAAWPVRAEHYEPAGVPRRSGRHRAARRRLDAVLPAIKDVDRHLLAALPATRRAAFQTILAELAEAADSKMSEEAPAKPMRRKAAGPKTPVARKRVKARAKR